MEFRSNIESLGNRNFIYFGVFWGAQKETLGFVYIVLFSTLFDCEPFRYRKRYYRGTFMIYQSNHTQHQPYPTGSFFPAVPDVILTFFKLTLYSLLTRANVFLGMYENVNFEIAQQSIRLFAS